MARVKIAKGFIAWYMKICGFQGWTSFWRTIYVMRGCENDERLIRHEMRHIEQIERDGRLLFSIKYLWWLARYGYWMNPYEVDARRAAEGAAK